LKQTLAELETEFARPEQVFLKAVVNGKIIGSVRGHSEAATTHLSRWIVHPYFQGRGIGRQLLDEIEKRFPHVKRFEVFTGSKSERNLKQLHKFGFQEFKTEPGPANITWVYLQKERK
jgi:ribosomal protein S18 acetylase RimI-like enzyme